jgi:hypothetical protein
LKKEIIEKYSFEELHRELKIRNRNIKLNKNDDVINELVVFTSNELLNFIKKKQQILYGNSFSKDFFEIDNPQILDDADSVVAMINSSQIQDNNDGTSYLETKKFGEAYDLCSDEKYREQPITALCSGVIVDSDVIATTGHCIDSENVSNTVFIFGFKINNIMETNIVINNSDIYKGQRIIGRELESGGPGPDWSLVQLDRKVENHKVARIRTKGKISDNTNVHVIGHPCGLPLKLGDNAIIKDNNKDSYFVANLDAFGGNPGSPVFNSDTHEVEGILAYGETDFIFVGNCNKSLICPNTGCGGVTCTRTTTFSHLL